MLNTVLATFSLILLFYISLSVLYLFTFAIAGRFFYKKNYASTSPRKKIAVIIPAYKEDGVILSTARSVLDLDYPRNLYDVYVIADSFQRETLKQLEKLPLKIFEVSFEKSTKAKALNDCFRRIDKKYDIALVCDADNVLAKNFLKKINDAFVSGAKAVQGRRVAKNFDTSYAILDAYSEDINNHIFRKGANAIGLASAVIGSGMAFEYDTCKEVLREINAVGGFDRPLQIKMIERGHKIIYLEDALIFDEKVDSLNTFKQQRRRWVSSQVIYLKEYFIPGVKQLLKGNFSYFNLAVINSVILPRAFLLILLPFLIVVSFFIDKTIGIIYLFIAIVFFISMLMSLQKESFNKNLLSAIIRLPLTALAMFSSVVGIRNSNKTFIHTTHSKTEVTNPLYEKFG